MQTVQVEMILLLDGLILAALGMDKGKYGYLGCILGWFASLRGAKRSVMTRRAEIRRVTTYFVYTNLSPF